MYRSRFESPVIGVTARHGTHKWVQKNTIAYLNVLAAYGATPVVLSPDQTASFPDGATYDPDSAGRLPARIIENLDGLILAGGGDVHPRYFDQPLLGAEERNIDLKRDELELGLARQAMSADLPLFGICRGCQVVNVAAGGGMIQHLPGHRSPEDHTKMHDVQIHRDTRLFHLIGTTVLQVNTFHHQGVDHSTLAPNLVAAAAAHPDGWLLEAFESHEHRWVLGVQWHPERLFELPTPHGLIWTSFLDACRLTAGRKPEQIVR